MRREWTFLTLRSSQEGKPVNFLFCIILRVAKEHCLIWAASPSPCKKQIRAPETAQKTKKYVRLKYYSNGCTNYLKRNLVQLHWFQFQILKVSCHKKGFELLHICLLNICQVNSDNLLPNRNSLIYTILIRVVLY